MGLTVLGGFLGSGKTTWLRHQLHHGAFANAVVVVNEAAETPVDDALLAKSAELLVLAGGCACCDGKAGLVALLRTICDGRSRMDSRGTRLQHIVLETSGLADPGPIAAAIRDDPVLVNHIAVSEIVATIDARHGLSQLRGEPLSRRQIETADRLIVTKVDEADHTELARLLATLQQLNPGAVISAAVRGSPAPLPPFAGAEPENLIGLAAAADRPPIIPATVVVDETTDWTSFSVWLSALLHARGEDVLRVKGVVRTPAGRLLVQGVRGIVQPPEILPEQPDGPPREDGVIAVIGRGFRQDQLRRSLRHFAGAGRT